LLIMTIRLLPDALKPGFHCVTARLVFRSLGVAGVGVRVDREV